MDRIAIVVPADLPALERFLGGRPATTMFFRSNLRAGGLADEDKLYHGRYAAAWQGGEVVAVAAHFWNGVVLVEAPVAVERVAPAALRAGRPVNGILGPWSQAVAARAALGMAGRAAAVEKREDLFALDLDRLVVPETLARGGVSVRRAGGADVDRLVPWRQAYSVETLGAAPGPMLESRARREIEELVTGGLLWVLEDAGEPVAMTGFNARLPDSVQVGGVYTPPGLRRRGLARAAVAGSLLEARRDGVERAILFTDEDNAAARAAYLALGFRIIGDYGIILFP